LKQGVTLEGQCKLLLKDWDGRGSGILQARIKALLDVRSNPVYPTGELNRRRVQLVKVAIETSRCVLEAGLKHCNEGLESELRPALSHREHQVEKT
jgi:hypothetical protein